MFNPYSVPGFAASLLFWLLAVYVLTRSPLSPISATAVLAQVATAAYFLGQAMQANAITLDEWLPWSRNLFWGAIVGPTAWCWLTILLLRDQPSEEAARLVRRVGYPVGVLVGFVGLALLVAFYAGDELFVWSAPFAHPAERATTARFDVPIGPWYWLLVAHLIGSTVAAAGFLALGRRVAADDERRRLFRWLSVCAVAMIPAASAFAFATWLGVELWALWVTDLAVALTVGGMTANAGAYGLLLRGRVIRADLLQFVSLLGLLCLAYVAVVVLAGPPLTFRMLELLVAVVLLTILAQGAAGLARRTFDRLFFSANVERVRAGLASAAQQAATSPERDLDRLVDEAQSELADVSAEQLAQLTQAALRRLNAPAGLADAELVERLPRTLAAVRARHMVAAGGRPSTLDTAVSDVPTPLEQAQALRTALVEAIERLKPRDPDATPGAPAALQYYVLHEAYVLGLPTRAITTRRGISESTFHRNRREAVAILARELARQEERLHSE